MYRPCPLPETDPRWAEIGQKLAEDSHAKIVERQVNAMDRKALDELYAGVGSMAYDPLMMLKMVLYQYLKQGPSPATWFEEAKLNEAMQWLGRGYTPSRRTWYDFRDRVGGVIEKLHEQVVQNAIEQKLIDPTTAVQDGTAVAACASRHRMLNKKNLTGRRRILNGVIAKTHPPSEPVPMWVPPTETGRHDLAKRMQLAEAVLDKRIEKQAEKKGGKRKSLEKITVSLSDPVAPLGPDKMKVFRPMYTVQCVMDEASMMVLGYSCDAVVTDSGTLIPMIEKTQKIVGGRLKTILADSAYCSTLDILGCRDLGVNLISPVQANSFTEKKERAKTDRQIPRDQFRFDAAQNSYECPAGHKLACTGRERKQRHSGQSIWESRYRCGKVHCGSCPLAKQCLRPGSSSRTIKRLDGQELVDAQRAKMVDIDVRKQYSKRGQTVELGFADAKTHRGFQRFHGRGLDRVRSETGLLFLSQNLLRLERLMLNARKSENIHT